MRKGGANKCDMAREQSDVSQSSGVEGLKIERLQPAGSESGRSYNVTYDSYKLIIIEDMGGVCLCVCCVYLQFIE